MSQNKRRPKYVEDLIEEVNHEMWNRQMKYDETNVLLFTIQTYLIHHGWYRGFNYFHDEVRYDADNNPHKVQVLHGSDQGYEYIQLF